MTHIIFAPNCASIRNLVIEIDFKKNDLLIVYHSKPENIRCRWVSDFLSFCKALTFLFFFARKAAQKFSLQRYKEYRWQKQKSFYKTAKICFLCLFISDTSQSIKQKFTYALHCWASVFQQLFTFAISFKKFNFAQACCKLFLSPFILELNQSKLSFSRQ